MNVNVEADVEVDVEVDGHGSDGAVLGPAEDALGVASTSFTVSSNLFLA